MTTEEVEELRAEVQRWTRRIKELERRLEVIAQVAEGRQDNPFAMDYEPREGEPLPEALSQELDEIVGPNPFLSHPLDNDEPLHDGLEQRVHDESRCIEGFNPFATGRALPTAAKRRRYRAKSLRELGLSEGDPLGAAPRQRATHLRAVMPFSEAMIAKLDKNAHKGHWSELDVFVLLSRLREETQELEEALCNPLVLSLMGESASVPLTPQQQEAYDKVCDEAVDVANFAMMIFDRYRRK